MPDLTVLQWTAMVVVMAAGAFVQGSVGFGMNVLAAPILVQIDPAVVPGPLLVTGLSISMLVARREHTAILVRPLTWAVAGNLPGVALGALAVSVLSQDQLALSVALVVLLAVALSATGVRIRVRPGSLFGTGLVSGVMGASTSIGGPPMALLLQRNEGPTVRANLGAFFVVGSAIAITGLAATGNFGLGDLLFAGGLVPGVIAGFLASGLARDRADKGAIRPAVLLLSAISAGSLLLRTVQ